MPQHRPQPSQFILTAYGLMAILSLGSFASATDSTITDGQLIFVDTSPSYQWAVFPDSVSFDINDNSAGKTPFRIKPGAPDFSFFLGANGQLGLGTSNPQARLHIKTADLFPTLRFESTDAVTWDLEAGINGFILYDVSNGNSFPFSVESGAPSRSLFVNSNGYAGFGVINPTAPIHVSKAAQLGIAESVARFQVGDDTGGRLDLNNASSTNGIFIPRLQGRSGGQNAALIMEGLITTDTGISPAIVYNASLIAGGPVATRPLVVYRNNNVAKVTIGSNGNVTATSFITASSRDLKDKITDLDSTRASAALRQLNPVEFVYKDDATAEPRIGFIAEDVPEIIAEPERKSVPVMDVVALVTRVVKDQQQTIDRQQKTIDDLMKRLEALESVTSAGK